MIADVLPRRTDGLEVAEFGSELVVLDLRCRQVHLLDGATAVVFDACDGVTSATELQQEFVKVLSLDPDAADLMVGVALDALRGSYLLTGHDPPPTEVTTSRQRRRPRWWRRTRRR
jgi:hypothetical protein